MSIELTAFEAYRLAEIAASQRRLDDLARDLARDVAKRANVPDAARWGFHIDADAGTVALVPPAPAAPQEDTDGD